MMHVQVVNLSLNGISDEEFRKLCDQLAPTVADVPGLMSKVWLANPATNTYGGVYLWRDRQAMEEFAKSEFFKSVATHPNLSNITSQDFGIIEGPTRLTRGLVEARV